MARRYRTRVLELEQELERARATIDAMRKPTLHPTVVVERRLSPTVVERVAIRSLHYLRDCIIVEVE